MNPPKSPPLSRSRVYCDVILTAPREYWDYENLRIQWGRHNHYEVIRRICRSKHSEYFEGRVRRTSNSVLLKVLHQVSEKKLKREIKILQNLQGGPNIVELVDVVRDPTTEIPTLVIEFVNNNDFRSLVPTFAFADVRFYACEILRALDFAHTRGIMHRNIKPQNILIDQASRTLRVADWSLAEFYRLGQQYNVRLGTRYSKPPELLTNLQDYDYSLDMWGFGCVLAGMIFKKEPFFSGRDDVDQLVHIAEVTGTSELFDYLERYDRTLRDVDGILTRDRYPRKPFSSFVNESNQDFATPLAVDLVSKCLVIDPRERLTAREAMEHEFFREMMND